MFDGLYLFEWVLMALGVILFVVLVIAFFYQSRRIKEHRRFIGILHGPYRHDRLSQPAKHSDQ